MEALRIVGVLLHRIFRLLLFPLCTLLSLFHLSLEFVSFVVCGLSTVLGGGLLIVVLICRFFGDMSNRLFLQTLVFSVLLAVIPRMVTMILEALTVGLEGKLRDI